MSFMLGAVLGALAGVAAAVVIGRWLIVREMRKWWE